MVIKVCRLRGCDIYMLCTVDMLARVEYNQTTPQFGMYQGGRKKEGKG